MAADGALLHSAGMEYYVHLRYLERIKGDSVLELGVRPGHAGWRAPRRYGFCIHVQCGVITHAAVLARISR